MAQVKMLSSVNEAITDKDDASAKEKTYCRFRVSQRNVERGFKFSMVDLINLMLDWLIDGDTLMRRSEQFGVRGWTLPTNRLPRADKPFLSKEDLSRKSVEELIALWLKMVLSDLPDENQLVVLENTIVKVWWILWWLMLLKHSGFIV